MKIGIIGLGRMGHAVAYRLLKKKHIVFGYDPDQNACDDIEEHGAHIVDSIKDIAKKCRIIWLMIPHDKIDGTLKQMIPYLKEKDIIIDGGNSFYKDTIKRAHMLSKYLVYFLDCGTSGGLKGKKIGYSLMIGGNEKAYKKCIPFFEAIATKNGYGYVGPSGSGHYVKMIHNGIEYVILQAYADGFNLLKNGFYHDLDLEHISNIWKHGSVIRSWILDLVHEIFEQDQTFDCISGAIGENKTGAWTLEEAKKQKVKWDALQNALDIRATSRNDGGNFSTKLVSLIRNKFGGHPVSLLENKKQ